jgi:hypothetical protein
MVGRVRTNFRRAVALYYGTCRFCVSQAGFLVGSGFGHFKVCPEGASSEMPVIRLQNAVKEADPGPSTLVLMRRFPRRGATMGLFEAFCMPQHDRQDSNDIEPIGLASALLSILKTQRSQ